MLFACGHWRGRFLYGGGRCRTTLTAPLPAALTAQLPSALHWGSWRRLARAATLAAAWRSAAALPWQRLAFAAQCEVLSGSRSLRVVVGAVASSFAAVAVARRSRRRCLRHRAGAPSAGSVVLPRARRRNARPPLFRGGGWLSRRGASCSAARTLCLYSLSRSLPLWRRWPSHGARGAAACGAVLALMAPALPCRRARGGVTLGRRSSWQRLVFSARCVVLEGSCSLRVVVGAVASSLEAVAVARRSRRRCLRRRTGAPDASLLVPPHSRRRGARPPLFRKGDSLSRRSASYSAATALRLYSLAWLLPLWRRSPSRGAHAAVACGAALALLALALPCRRARGGVTLGRRYPWRRFAFSARCVVLGGSCSLRVVVGAVASSLGGGRRRTTLTPPLHAALTAPLPAAPHWRS